jgi:gliding motility-associated-like protein
LNKKIYTLLFCVLTGFIAKGQFTATTTPSVSATQLVNKFAGNGVLISNATLTCPDGAAGVFYGASSSLAMDSGMVLTTGTVLTYTAGGTIYGVNAAASASAQKDNGVIGGDVDLAASANQPIGNLHDLCKLDFDFIPLSDTVKFNYRFGSEEYPDFNCTNFSDIFAFYITSGIGYSSATNIALIPGTTIAVSVNSINSGTLLYGTASNCSSLGAGSPFTSLYVNNSVSTTIVYNGLTQLLQAKAVVVPCSTYHMKIAIADLGDGDRDSGVFLEANSFEAEVAKIDTIISPNNLTQAAPFAMEGCNADTIIIARPNPKPFPLTVNITLAGSATYGTDYTCVTSVTIPANATSTSFTLNAFADLILEGTETIKLYIYGSPCSTVITDSAVISLLEYPLYNVSNNDTTCPGQTAILSANIISATTLLTFNWNPGNFTGNNYSVIPTSTTTYTCSAIYPGCPPRDTLVTITVATVPVVDAGPNVSICNGVTTNLAGTVTGFAPYSITNQWTPLGTLNNSTILNPVASPVGTTIYTLTCTTNAGCSASDTVSVTVAPVIVINTTIVNPTCNGFTNGTITATTTGTTGLVTYTLQPGASTNTTGIFTGLGIGNYTISVVDGNGCTKTKIVTVTQPAALLTGTSSVLNVLCNNQGTGSISLSASGGTGAINFTLNPGAITNSSGNFTSLAAGVYTIVATDANGCMTTKISTVTQPTALIWNSTTSVNISCNGQANGTISTGMSNGVPMYTYSILPGGTSNNTGFFGGLAVNIYTITGTDANGCTKTTTVSIIQPAPLILSTPTLTSPTCIPGNNGIASVTASGGTAAYSYTIFPGAITNTTGTFTGLNIGAFQITATDSKGCTSSATFNLAYPNAPVMGVPTIVNISCFGNTNGSIAISATGGASPINYLLNPGAVTNTSGNFSSLSAGTYTITGTDANGCSTVSTVVITTPLTLNFASATATNVSCNNGTNGLITTAITGGTAAFTYLLSPGAITSTTGSFSNLVSGTYTIQVTDANGCTKTTSVTLSNPPVLVISTPTVTNVLCNGASTGTISTSASGGTPGYSYNIQPTNTTNTTGNFINKPAGTYTITVTDSKGCTKTTTAIITQPTAVIISSSNIVNTICVPNNTGSVNLSATGGVPGYTYVFGTIVGSSIITSGTNSLGNITNLTAGAYIGVATDLNGCKDTVNVTITQIPGPNIDSLLYVLPLQCNIDTADSAMVIASGANPFLFTLNPNNISNTTGFFDSLTPGPYTIVVTDANGCTANTSFVIQTPQPITSNLINYLGPVCNNQTASFQLTVNNGLAPYVFYNYNTGVSNSTGIFTNVPPGILDSVLITDANGCTTTHFINIINPAVLLGTFTHTNLICNLVSQGQINMNITGGFGIYSYNILPGGFNGTFPNNTSISHANLAAGTYTVIVTDALGCTTSSIQIITQPIAISFTSFSSTNPSCSNPNNGSITVVATGGTGALSYNIGGSNQSSGAFTSLSSNTYIVTVTDANGCTKTSSIILAIPNGPSVSSVAVNFSSCGGANSGTATVNCNGGSAPYAYTLNTSATNSTGIFTGLPAATYTVTVSDLNNCTVTASFTITAIAAMSFTTFNIQNAVCNAQNSGSINFVMSGGTGPLSYNLMPGNITSAIPLFNNLLAGTYTVTVTDINNCSVQSIATITQPTAITFSNIATTVPTCIPNNNGGLSVTANGGNGPYSYFVSGFSINTTGVFTGMIGTSYVVIVTDASSCTNSTTIVINPPSYPVMNSITQVGTSCYGGSNGSISSNASAGSGSIIYSISPGTTTNSTGNFTGLNSGNYLISATDASGCLTTSLILVTQPPQYFLTLNSATPPACNGNNNGSINLTASGGTGTISYNLQPNNTTNTTGIFTGLIANTYTIIATDVNSCTLSSVINLANPNPVVWNSAVILNPALCYGDSSGQVQLNAGGGSGTINYSIPALSITNTNGNFATLATGTYTFFATDANGCATSTTLFISQPPTPISISNISNTSPTCVPGNDASAIITATGGTGAYTYGIIGVGTNTIGTFNNLGANTYTATVTDANGCVKTSLLNIANTAAPIASGVIQSNVFCVGASTGSITMANTGGTGPVSYTLSPGGQVNYTGVFSNLIAQNYTVTLLDSVGCSSTYPFAITQPAPVIININSISTVLCFGGTGTINFSATGGGGGFTYSIQPLNVSNTSGIFNNVPANSYTLIATDANGCSYSTMANVITPPALYWIAFNSGNTLCYGDSTGFVVGVVRGGTGTINYVLQPIGLTDTVGLFFNVPANTYTVLATDANGCTISSSTTVSQPNQILFTNMTNTFATCLPGNDGTITCTATGGTNTFTYGIPAVGTNTNGQFIGLSNGTFTVTATDANGCTGTSSTTLIPPSSPIISQITTVPAGCNPNNNGSATITATNGTTPYQYKLNNGALQSSNVFNSLVNSIYTVTVQDANGCTSTSSFAINSTPNVAISSLTSTNINCFGNNNGTINVVANVGGTPYSYNLSPVNITNSTGGFSNLAPGNYTIQVTDANGCTATSSVDITQPPNLIFNATTSTNVPCFGAANGTITTSASGGTGTLVFALSPIGTQASPGVFTNLAGNITYTVTVTDSFGCVKTNTILITQPPNLVWGSSTINDVLCQNQNNGAITTVATGGTGLITYNLQPGNISNTTGVFTNLFGNIYTITATDINSCIITSTYDIFAPNSIQINSNTTTPVTCFGNANGTVSITASGGVGQLSYNIMPTNINNTSGIFSGLAGNTYTIVVTDTNGCDMSTTSLVNEPLLLKVDSQLLSHVNCFNGNNASIQLYTSGGNGTNIYSISPIIGSNLGNGLFTNLTANTYTITTTDFIGCSTVGIFTITQPTILTWGANTITNITCKNQNNGSIVTVVTGGTGTISYNLQPSNITNTTGTFNSLSGIIYTITATDTKGCSTTSSYSIFEPSAILISNITNIPVTCYGNANGSSTITASGGVGILDFNLMPINITNNTGAFNNLYGNNYTVTITDTNGCDTSALIIINEPAILKIDSQQINNVSCFNGNNGQIHIFVSGGNGSNVYAITPTIGTNLGNGLFTNLTNNTYTITATDFKGCSTTTIITITQPTNIIWNTNTITNVTCFNANNGSINTSATGGTGTLTYNLQPGNISNTSGVFNNLSGNTYTITVTDINNCSKTSTYFIYEPNAIIVTTNTNTPVTCFGNANGTATVFATGGVGQLTYTINPLNFSNTTGLFTNLGGNNYTVTVTDTNNCDTTTQVIIFEPTLLKIDSQQTANILCYGLANGVFHVYASGGNGGNTYSISPNAGTNMGNGLFTNLTANTYTITVTDFKNCTTTSTANISENSLLVGVVDSIRNLSCNSSVNGAIFTNAVGGVGPYLYTLLPGNGSNNTGDYFNLVASTYTVIITDANNCTTAINNIIVNQPVAIVIDSLWHQDVVCYSQVTGIIMIRVSGGTGGFSYNLMPGNITNSTGNFLSLSSGNYTVTATDITGCTLSTQVLIKQTAPLTLDSVTYVSPTCFGMSNGSISFFPNGGTSPLFISFNGGPFTSDTLYTNLKAGTYHFQIIDINQCTSDTNLTLTEPAQLYVIIDSFSNPYCHPLKNGEIHVHAQGGNIGTYAYYLNPVTMINNSGHFYNLANGTYGIQIIDSLGCKADTTITLDESENNLQIDFTTTPIACLGDGFTATATAIVTGGIPPYSYLWSNVPPDTTMTADTLGAYKYIVFVTDSKGCKIDDSIYITPSNCCDAYIPNAFTPNGDNINDEFKPIPNGSVENIAFSVFDRWGNKVFSGINNYKGWDGTFKGQPMDVETYYYILTYTCIATQTKNIKKGDFTLIR